VIFERIKELCRKNNISIYKLENEMGFSHTTISKWEKVSPRVNNLKKVADYFGVTVDFLIRGSS